MPPTSAEFWTSSSASRMNRDWSERIVSWRRSFIFRARKLVLASRSALRRRTSSSWRSTASLADSGVVELRVGGAILGVERPRVEARAERLLLRSAEDPFLHPLGEIHDVGIGLAIDGELHRLGAVDSDDHVSIAVIGLHPRHIPQAHLRIPNIRQHDVGDVVDGEELVEGPHQEFLVPLLHLSRRGVEAFLAEALADEIER